MPASFATETFFGVNSFRFSNEAGKIQFGRYRLEPLAGSEHLGEEQAAKQLPNFLTNEMEARLQIAPVQFRLIVQLADPTDNVDDGSIAWPMSRPVVDIGTIRLRALSENGAERQRTLLFTPLNLVGGIAPSLDPMLAARNRAYRISLDRRARSARAEAGTPEASR
jgi:catalase